MRFLRLLLPIVIKFVLEIVESYAMNTLTVLLLLVGGSYVCVLGINMNWETYLFM